MKVCAICIAQFGFSLSDKSKTFETDEEHYEHMENVHGAFVIREGETEQQAEERCAKRGIVADRAICQCEECKILREENTMSWLEYHSNSEKFASLADSALKKGDSEKHSLQGGKSV